ncbi:diphosphomevalonate decarboxylase [bacterium]|nr:diphosphomevalonate decarboxylase [bacterium]
MSTLRSKWESPSNIALVKYWGKQPEGVQLPANASISFTLSESKTITAIDVSPAEQREVKIWLDGDLKPDFLPKIETFFDRIAEQFPWLDTSLIHIDTKNTFPYGTGIASSASSMSALALCICDIAVQRHELQESEMMSKASEIARLGSGSACRSIYAPLAEWGRHYDFEGSSDDFATPFIDVSPLFKDFCDTILLVDSGQKEVSSTIGHALIENHPFGEKRFELATVNMSKIKSALENGDLDSFMKVVESEALMLHALMMTSDPYFILMKANTLAIIEKIWAERGKNKRKWCFTLDAGANVHFLYPAEDEQIAKSFVDKELKQYCQNGLYICDRIGSGPNKLI